MKRIVIAVMLLGIAAMLIGAQANQQMTMEQFMEQLRTNLQERGWSDAELDEFARQAREYNWEGARYRNTQIIAQALHYAKRQGEPAGLQQAQVALQTALMAMEMEHAGFSGREVARTALESVREMLQLRTQLREDAEDQNREMFRERLRDREREQLMARVAEQVRERARTQAEERLQNRDRSGMRHGEEALGNGSGSMPSSPGENAGPDKP